MSDLFCTSSPEITKSYSRESSYIILHGDANESLKDIPSESIQLIVSSPPYNIGKEYEKGIVLKEYLESMTPVLEGMVRILSQEGSICWQVGNYVDNGEIVPLDICFYPIFKSLGLKMRNRIIWHFDHGLHASKRFSGRYETICWFTKSDSYVFNLDPVRVPSKYPGKTHFKGEKRGLPSGNPLGKNPSDFWKTVEQDWDRLIWEIPNVKANHPEKTIHPCQFPIELVQRCILALSNENDFVLDPFGGAGTIMIAAMMHKRKAIICEKEEKYIEITMQRINDYSNGRLKIRPLGKPVYSPSGKEKVSQIPILWSDEKEKITK